MIDREHGLLLQIGRYRITRLLGRGAMGEVLLAHDPVLERNVAIKHLRRDLNISPEQREALTQRLWQEARALARVSHPNIVALHDMGEDPKVGPYLVFEYLDGLTLKSRLAEGPLDPKLVARLGWELAGALATAHRAGVLHRDVKPENILLSKLGTKIADFGIARVPNSTLTRGGALLGTPAYSAPETLQGFKFSPASDQFSLAATLYEALSGKRAFPGDDALLVASRVRNDEPERLARSLGLDPRVDAVLGRALSKNPGTRFGDCAELGAALASALDGDFVGDRALLPSIPPSSLGSQPDATSALSAPIPPPTQSSRWQLLLPALLGAAVAALVVYFVLSGLFGGGRTDSSQAPHAGAPSESPRASFIEQKAELETPAAGSRPRASASAVPLPRGSALHASAPRPMHGAANANRTAERDASSAP